MARKRVIKIPKTAMVKCPNCENRSRMKVPQNQQDTIQFFECKKCKQKISTPIMKCCIICAFSNKRCTSSLMAEARVRGLKVRCNEKDISEKMSIFKK